MKVLPDKLIPTDTDRPEEQFERLGRAIFRADPEKVKAILEAEEAARDKANGGVRPRKRGRPKRAPRQ
jgi:hypothetical protein